MKQTLQLLWLAALLALTFNATAQTWTNTTPMANPRYAHTSTLLPNGQVLVTGGANGGGVVSSAELYDPSTGLWTSAGAMATPRHYHTATLLPTGRVLVTGGHHGSYLSSAELYEPASGLWTNTSTTAAPRYIHTATLLPNGRVLVTGGFNGSLVSSAELYDPSAGLWTNTTPMANPRYVHTATLLPNGQVLVTGGYNNGGGVVPSAELYVPALRIATDLADVTAVVGSSATFQVVAAGEESLDYQWFYTSSEAPAMAGAYAQTIVGFVYGAVVTNGGYGYTTAPRVQFIGGGGSGALGYTTVSNGSVYSIILTNAGSGYSSLPTVVIDPPSGLLPGQTNSHLTLNDVGPRNRGTYQVVVSDGSGSVTSRLAEITLLYPPDIEVQPASQDVSLRGAVTLSVTPSGTAPFQYQWRLAGTNLPTATNSTLALVNFSTNHVGRYTVRVTSPYGSVTSSPAEVNMLPSLNVPFAGGVQLWGQPAILNVGAVGTGALQYQWYYNGQAISGATSNSFRFESIQFTNAGFYSVVVSSSLGSVTNTPYQVVVNPADVGLGLFPGVIITGTIDYNYAIQGSTDLRDTNAWVTLTNLTLTQPVQIWSDYTADTTQPGNPRKYYRVRAIEVPVDFALVLAGTLPATSGLGAQPVGAFYMAKTETTWGQWQSVRTWALTHGYPDLTAGAGVGDRYPVTTVNSYDAMKWCNARSEQEGLTPVYTFAGGALYQAGNAEPEVSATANGYRLPSEKEWEFAARGGVNTRSYLYSGSDNIDGVAVFSSNSGGTSQVVGAKLANELNISDMSGNVYEWCFDFYNGDRPIRGGGWYGPSVDLLVASRHICSATDRQGNIGFRVVRNFVP